MDNEAPHILVVDDDRRLRELLRRFLAENGFLVTTAEHAADARQKLGVLTFDLMVLDVMMPGESGLELAADLRRDDDTPILMLTAMGEPEDRIAGLEAGVDDYLAKPFDPRELLLRINAILKRAAKPRGEPPAELRLGSLTYDVRREALTQDGEPVHLTTQEAVLLRLFAERPGQVFSREDLTQLTGAVGGERSIDVQITRLRRKIEPDQRLPRYLQTVRGRGYVLKPD